MKKHARRFRPREIEPHLQYQTKFTRTGERDYSNRKPYRTKSLKARAVMAAKKDDDGAFRCPLVHVHYHAPVA